MQPIEIQQRLKDLGFWTSGKALYNNYGPATKAAVIAFQKSVGLVADGIAGPQTIRALFPQVPKGLIDLVISKAAIDKLTIPAEIGSITQYNQKYRFPTFPGGGSGLTIGIGYDLGYNTASQIAADWGDLVDANTLKRLQSVAGLKGDAAKAKLSSIKDISIPYDDAKQVFLERTLFRFAKEAVTTYPGLQYLFPDATGTVVDTVFNRGASLIGTTRVEMAALKPAIQNADYKEMANQYRKMKRWWDGIANNGEISRFPGLVIRCEDRAVLCEHATHDYFANDVVHLYI